MSISDLEKNITPYSRAIVKLLQSSCVEQDAKVWDDIMNYQGEIQKYISKIGLELIVKSAEGFAFVKQFEDSEGKTLGLIKRQPLSFEVSIVLLFLRQSLEEFDSNPSYEGTTKFITDLEIKEELELFLQEGFNKLKFQKELQRFIQKAVELGYLKEKRKNEYETTYQIQRIIKEKITLDQLKSFKERLQEYVQSI